MWYQLGNIALGIWLLAAPTLLPSSDAGARLARVVGPIVIWLAALSLRAVTRPFHLLNLLPGLTLVIAPWLVPNTPALTLACVLTGWAIILLSLPSGAVRQRVGGGWWAVVRADRPAPNDDA